MSSYPLLRGVLVLIVLVGLLVWFIWLTLRKAVDPRAMRMKWCVTFALLLGLLVPVMMTGPSHLGAFVVPVVAAGIGVILSILWAPHIAGMMAKPITAAIDGGNEEVEARPLYSIALSRRMSGRYEEALKEIQAQLEKFPRDFEGLMLSAAIAAENLNDLPRAEVIVQRLVNLPGLPPGQLAGALNSLADWQLRFGQDPEAARQALEQIMQRLPDTSMAAMAQQRLAHLTQVGGLVDAFDRPTLTVTPGDRRLGLRQSAQDLVPAEPTPAEEAGKLLQRLQQFPEDNEAREQLARVYAEGYHRPEMAILELEQLIARPLQPAKQVVHWLHLIADIQIKHLNNVEAAAAALQRVIDGFPNAAAAENARTRMNLLRLEQRGQEKPRAVTLGEYEQRLGLKGTKADQRREDRG